MSFLKDQITGFVDTIKEIRTSVKRSKSKKIKAYIIDDVRNVEEYEGILSENKKFIFVSDYQRVWMEPKIYYHDGKPVAYLPLGYHGTPDASMDVAKAQKYEVKLKWRNPKKWDEVTCEATGCIDWNLFDNDLSPNLSHQSYLVMGTRPFEWLGQPGNLKLLLIIGLCLVFGFATGFFSSTIINLIYRFLQ